VAPGDVVRAHERDNIGTVNRLDHFADSAVVHLVSPDGYHAPTSNCRSTSSR
jgi:hypothetical protein